MYLGHDKTKKSQRNPYQDCLSANISLSDLFNSQISISVSTLKNPVSVRLYFKCPVLSDQLSKMQRYLVYCHLRQREGANSHTGKAGTRECLTFLLET